MSYQVFARKYRPTTFKDVLGQDHVVQTLANAIAQDRLAHAYLFVGPRGTGKTSTARIFAKALNCSNGPSIDFDPNEDICQEIAEGRSLDVLEIDGASNNGVEQVRELRETVKFAPARCRFKIYYIDEVHMLSSAAFNALLKTLEEPPPHVKFIFATTEAHKILPTIISRCQRFDLRPIPSDIIAKQLIHISDNEGVKLDQEAAWSIAKGADGGMRDAQSMLDQLVAFCGEHITGDHVRDIFGFTSAETVFEIISAVLKRDNVTALQAIHEQNSLGKDLSQLLGELISAVRSLLISKVQGGGDSAGLPENHWEQLLSFSEKLTADRLLAVLDLLAESEAKIRWASDKTLHLEIALIRSIQTLGEVSLNDLVKTIGRLPDDLPVAQSTAPATVLQSVQPAETENAAKAVIAGNSTPAAQPPSPPEEKQSPREAPIEVIEPSITESATVPVSSPTSSPASKAPPESLPTPPKENAVAEASIEETKETPMDNPLSEDAPIKNSRVQRTPRKPAARKSVKDISDSLDRLMADAPETLPESEMRPEAPKPQAPVEQKPKLDPEEKKKAQEEVIAKREAEQARLNEEFYSDPLIQEALTMFEATLKK